MMHNGVTDLKVTVSLLSWGHHFELRNTQVLPLDEAVASRAVFVIVSGSDGRAETLLDPAK